VADTITQPGLFEMMYSCRSMRRLSPRPVPEALLLKLVEAGMHAPSAANAQNWRFVVVRNREVMASIAQPWRRGIAIMQEFADRAPARAGEDLDARRRTMRAVVHLADHFEETPAVICVCVRRDVIGESEARRFAALRSVVRHLGLWRALRLAQRARRNAEQELWANAYTAAQNILLAARASGLGAVLTMPQVLAPPGTYERILGLPDDVRLAALIPVGYPLGRFGSVSRAAPAQFVAWDRYEPAPPIDRPESAGRPVG